MTTEIKIQARAFPVCVRDERSGREDMDFIVLDKPRLQAAQMVGQSSKELICRIYNARGYRVLDIGKAHKREIVIDLTQAWIDFSDTENTCVQKFRTGGGCA